MFAKLINKEAKTLDTNLRLLHECPILDPFNLHDFSLLSDSVPLYTIPPDFLRVFLQTMTFVDVRPNVQIIGKQLALRAH